MNNDYWRKQTPGRALFDDVLWSKPERRDQAGRLAIVGGNSQGFWAVAASYNWARKAGVGEVRVLVPDALKSKLPRAVTAQISDLIMTDSNPSGGFAMSAENDLIAAAHWAGNLLLIGDSGANSETAQLFAKLLIGESLNDVRITIARDAVDAIIYNAEAVLNRPKTTLILSVAQLQKLARAIYYPRVITFSQGIRQIAETLHKFTITYGATVVLFHDDNLFVANGGDVVSQNFAAPTRVWNGEVPTVAAVWQVWQADPLKAIATSWTAL